MSKIFTLLSTLAFLSLFFFIEAVDLNPNAKLPTYFNYSREEIAPLFQLHSKKEMRPEELAQWDEISSQVVSQKKLGTESSRLFAYLYVAQRDAAFLSRLVKNHFEGSLNPISSAVLKLFDEDFDAQSFIQNNDPYSIELAKIVMKKIQMRLQEDRQQTYPFPMKTSQGLWKGKVPFYGIEAGSWKTWFLSSGNEFRLPPPPPFKSPDWERQISDVKRNHSNLTKEQNEAINYWANTGDWRKISNEYLFNQKIPFNWMLFIRSIMAMALEDASIAVFDSKYTYFVKRPAMMDPSIQETIPSPNHPSYPSGHSTLSSTAAVILSYFFPQNAEKWQQLASECGMSRIWAGIHFPLDHQAGISLGTKIGQTTLETIQQQTTIP